MKKVITAILTAAAIANCISVISFAETDKIIYGDANCDNEVDVRDVTALNQHLVGINELSEQGIKNCDFFCDNEITVQSLLNLKKKIIRTVSSLEPLAYYQITDEEIQEYLADDDCLVVSHHVEGIIVDIPIEDYSNFCFSYAGTPEYYFSFNYLGLPNEIVSHSYTMDLEYTINGVIKEGKSVSLEFYDAYPENLARIYLAIKKEISTKTNSSLYHVNYAIVCY